MGAGTSSSNLIFSFILHSLRIVDCGTPRLGRRAIGDPHRLDRRVFRGPLEFDGEKSIMQLSSPHFDAVGEAEAPLEAPRGDTPVEIIARRVVRLLAAYDQLAALYGDGKLIHAEARDGERDAKRASRTVALRQKLDIVRRVASLWRSDEAG